MQFSLLVLFSEGWLPSNTVGAPVDQGLAVAGMQGMGVKTPIAAEVAEATVGFDRDVHIAKGRMFTIGIWSWMLAAGWLPVIVRLRGSTTRLLGAVPKLHIKVAPLQTWIGMVIDSRH